jgi:RNA polymerase sigma-70 factor (ECF subfamily)
MRGGKGLKDNFIAIYDEYFDDVYRYILMKTGNKWDTDDIVSEVFRKVFEKHSTITGSAKAWLFTLTRNSIADFYRRKKNIEIPVDELEDELLFTEEETEDEHREEALELLKEALIKLTKNERELINLRYFADIKYRDIGTLTGIKENILRTKISRTLKKLRLIMENLKGGSE